MKPHPRVSKTVKWGGAVVSVVLVAIAVASGWRQDQYISEGGGWWVTLQEGCVTIGGRFGAHGPAMFPGRYVANDVFRFDWRPDWFVGSTEWYVHIPLWIPGAVALLCGLTAWRFDVAAAKRGRRGSCAKCGYDLRGLGLEAACPECGAARAT